jgi:hypothetical protein
LRIPERISDFLEGFPDSCRVSSFPVKNAEILTGLPIMVINNGFRRHDPGVARTNFTGIVFKIRNPLRFSSN